VAAGTPEMRSQSAGRYLSFGSTGPGYRVYFTRRRQALVILLCGSDKRTQSRDIRKATGIAEKLED